MYCLYNFICKMEYTIWTHREEWSFNEPDTGILNARQHKCPPFICALSKCRYTFLKQGVAESRNHVGFCQQQDYSGIEP